ncbi:MAG TPA: UDP-glucose/GDP-mannose dehydrogenase family protein [Fimbriimonadaceae bacterium]|nr:UDP-glucose/GDP-mannose dehydrogenase family protein [Fimbriimonadaceae bacterium]
MKIAVVGTGYVGLVTGVVLASLGNDVICVDKDREKLDRISKGQAPIYEPGLEELIQRSLSDGYLRVSDSIIDSARASDIVFIAVGTPPAEDGSPDLSAVREVAAEIAAGIESYTIVVNKSTVPVGSGDLVANIILSKGVPADRFDVVSNPEFLREGSAIRDTLEPDRIVIGAKNPEAAQMLVELYAPLNCKAFITDLNTAELIKYASNSFLALKISFINALSQICEACGADVGDAAAGIGADSRIGSAFLHAGLGWGGSCFPKDVRGMISTSQQFGYDFRLLKEVIDINDSQVARLLDRIENRLGGFAGRTVALLGLAFKANTDDIREARSLILIEHILGRGGKVQACDPVAVDVVRRFYPDVTYCHTPYESVTGADAAVVVTEWNEFKQLDLARIAGLMKQPLMFDGRRIYSREKAERAGLEYFAIGSSAPNEAPLPT